MVELFIKHVLGVESDHPGIYGDTSAYYGTVEQQGRLTLHLHLLLWIRGSLTPQEVRKRIMDPSSDFQRKIIEYLESTHIGEFLTGTQDDVLSNVNEASHATDYSDPTQTLPVPPPQRCPKNCNKCNMCCSLRAWWLKFNSVVDDIMSKSNIHYCTSNKNKDGTVNKARQYIGCLNNKWGKCKARFPRPIFKVTEVDPETGALNMKKGEPMINTVTPLLTYLFRCNTDVTSLKSGTAIKGVILYVSDYITKVSLKTHVIFDTVRAMFHKNSEMIGGSETRKEKARRLMTKIVNSLSAKMEIGAPMACMYLLRNPDHYTNHRFAPFYWQSYVQEARKVWHPKDSHDLPEKVTLMKRRGKIIGLSPVYDYIYRSHELENMNLYDWVRRCTRKKLPKSKDLEGLNAMEDGLPGKNYDEPSGFPAGDDEHEREIDDVGFTPDSDSGLPSSGIGISSFLDCHPLYKTHGTRCVPEVKALLPNFIGATLPRCDQGDREYYCTTMLTLFKPWRSGHDLKSMQQTWDESFLSNCFTQRQEQLMVNFNIRYECLDARDDFHAQMRKGSVVMPSWATSNQDVFNDIDQSAREDDANCLVGNDGFQTYDEVEDHLKDTGRRHNKRMQDMAVMKDIITRTGWTEEMPNDLPEGLDLKPSPPELIQNGSLWKAAVQKKRQDILEQRAQHLNAGSEQDQSSGQNNVPNRVRLVDKSYLERTYHSPTCQLTIDKLVQDYKLNREQERAFRIVANHASSPLSEQLKMHIGGMGGTGKTQVLKALVEFFRVKNESHRFVVVAPTGSAAALLAGSTYHYMFGINDNIDDRISNVQLAQVKSRLEGVQYVFLDEVSMLSCRDMYRISARLARIMNESETPFGGMNMIFAGDFAQLPPAIGQENVSLYSRTVGSRSTDKQDQEASIGKALWHQVNTVVILRENMRQKSQSREDTRLREALANMRYRACNPADLAFLRSRISSDMPGRSSVRCKEFRHVSVITALNIHKDEINRLGSLRFARETGQDLTHFFSEDSVSSRDDRKDKRSFTKGELKVANISDVVQNVLWNQSHSANSKNIPGKLSLCLGLPVMIRHNAATELCMTKGQEGVVHGWQSSKGSRNQRVLETLFVKLVNPPQAVKFDGLPENVVPLTATSVSTVCFLPDDSSIKVSRKQVEVLPNFSMTDYSSQGKTRPYNVVDLNNSRLHQSYYTALSRSASAAGTYDVPRALLLFARLRGLFARPRFEISDL